MTSTAIYSIQLNTMATNWNYTQMTIAVSKFTMSKKSSSSNFSETQLTKHVKISCKSTDIKYLGADREQYLL